MLKRDKFREILQEAFRQLGKIFGTDGSVLLVSDTVSNDNRTRISPAQLRKLENLMIFTFFEEINPGIRRFVRACKLYLR